MRRYPAALRALEREIALNPNSWRSEWLRALLMKQWKGDLSASQHLRPPTGNAREIYVHHWFNTLLNVHRFDDAEEIVRSDPREMLPWYTGSVPKSFFLGYLYRAKKDERKAREYFEAALPVMERALTEAPMDAQRHMALAEVYAQLHRRDDAIREGKRACELLPETKDVLDGVELLEGVALNYLEVGEEALALAVLEHSLSVPGGAHVGTLRTSHFWEPFRNNSRFQQLLAKYEPRH
jgi:tetratricopeptide (TPR) repeat protein